MRRLARWILRLYPRAVAGAVREQFNMQSFKRLAGWLSAAGLVAGLLGSYLVAPKYTSEAVILLRAPGAAEIMEAARAEVVSRWSLATLINDPRLDLYRTERQSAPLETVEEDMRLDLKLAPQPAPDGNSSALSIAYTYREPVKAQGAVNQMISALTRIVEELQRRDAQRSGQIEETFTVMERPSLPVWPVSPNRGAFAAAGFGAGLALALLLTVWRGRYLRRPVDPLCDS